MTSKMVATNWLSVILLLNEIHSFPREKRRQQQKQQQNSELNGFVDEGKFDFTLW